MTRYLTLLFALLVLATACSKERGEALAARPDAATPAPPPVAPPAAPEQAADPAEVLVTVNGHKFTRGEAQEEVRYRLASLRSQAPPQQLAAMQQQMFGRVVDQFVAKQLLVGEADARKIEATPEDEKKAFDKIAASLPEGMTVEQVMKTSPLGEERMRDEVILGIRIEKLFEQVVTNELVASDAEVDEYMEENQARMTMPEQVQASHILFGVAEEEDDAAKAEKKKQAEEVRQKLVDGADFGELAKEHSSCPSKNRGGDLGKFGRGRMVKPFEDAAFTQEVDEIGPVVETKFGYHIIKVTEHDTAGEVPRERVAEYLARQKKSEAMVSFVEGLRAKADIKYLEPQTPPALPPAFQQMQKQSAEENSAE